MDVCVEGQVWSVEGRVRLSHAQLVCHPHSEGLAYFCHPEPCITALFRLQAKPTTASYSTLASAKASAAAPPGGAAANAAPPALMDKAKRVDLSVAGSSQPTLAPSQV